MYEPIRVGLYGSSLFLSVVAAALERHTKIILLNFPAATPVGMVLQQNLTTLLWQNHCPPADISILFEAGLWLLEIDEYKSQITIQHRNQSQKQILPITGSANLIAWIGQQVQINPQPDAAIGD